MVDDHLLQAKDDYDSWSEERQIAEGKALRGLGAGDLQPLADLLKLGHGISNFVAYFLIRAIEHNEMQPYHLVTKGAKKGQLSWAAEAAITSRKLAIGRHYEKRTKELPRGSHDAIIAEIGVLFDVGPSQAKVDLADSRKWNKKREDRAAKDKNS